MFFIFNYFLFKLFASIRKGDARSKANSARPFKIIKWKNYVIKTKFKDTKDYIKSHTDAAKSHTDAAKSHTDAAVLCKIIGEHRYRV